MQEIIINKNEENTRTIAIIENGILVERYIEKQDKTRLEGNIYVGKVENVMQGMQAAFINVGEGKNAFIHLKDLLPKVDITKEKNYKLDEINIKDIAKQGSNILVQVKRDSTSLKGPRVSTHISLVGRYVVLMPETEIITVSQKIENKNKQEELKKIVKELLPKNYGIIIRTSAENKKKEDIEKDIECLIKRWKKIKNKEKELHEPTCIERNNEIIGKIIIDIIDKDISKIVVNNKEDYEKIKNILEDYEEEINLELKEENLLELYGLQSQIEKCENRKVWLKCGGFITIDKTEALVAIDVNSGKYTGKTSLEETVLKVNKEASEEIAKQLRLRDIGGIIIIDYIDMNREESKKEVINVLKESLKNDRSKTQIEEFTKLNLLEMTRKHMFSNE